MKYKAEVLWVLVMAVVLVAAFVIFTTPETEKSGVVTDKWETEDWFVLEIDNSFTEHVDDYVYHNVEVEDTYYWGETSVVVYVAVGSSLVAVVVFGVMGVVYVMEEEDERLERRKRRSRKQREVE